MLSSPVPAIRAESQDHMLNLESMGSALREPVVVIGAGIVGVSAAYHLLTAGARNVTVIDRVEPGEGTTKAGAGFVAKWNEANYDFGPGGLQLQDYALQFYRSLHASRAPNWFPCQRQPGPGPEGRDLAGGRPADRYAAWRDPWYTRT